MDARDRSRSSVSFGLDPLACWSGLAGWTAGCCSRDHHQGCNGAGAPPRLHHGPRGPGWQEPQRARRRTTNPVRPASAFGTTLGAATSGRGWCCRSGYDQRRHAPSPSPPTAPVRPGMVQQCGQDRQYVGGYPVTTRSPTLASVGKCSLADGHGPSDGLSSARRVVGPCRRWRPRGRSVGAGLLGAGATVGGSPSAPYTLRGWDAAHPARLCAVSWAGAVSWIASGARLRRRRGHRAGRSQSAASSTPWVAACRRMIAALGPAGRSSWAVPTAGCWLACGRPRTLNSRCGPVAR